MTFTACPVCGQIPTYLFDFCEGTAVVVHYECTNASGRPQ